MEASMFGLRSHRQYIPSVENMHESERPEIAPHPQQYFLDKGVDTYYFSISFLNPKTGKREWTRRTTNQTDLKKAERAKEQVFAKFLAKLYSKEIKKSEVQPIETLIESFLNSKHYSLSTLKDIKNVFNRFLKDAHGKPVCDIDSEFLQQHLQKIHGRVTNPIYSSPARCKAKKYLQSLFSFAVQRRLIERNPLDLVTLARIEEPDRDYFLPVEFEKFWIRMPEHTYAQRSLKNLTLLASATAGRLYELICVKQSDIDWHKRRIVLKQTKNRKRRTVLISARVKQAIERQLLNNRIHKKECVQGSEYLFPNEKGQVLISADRKTNPVSNRFRKVRETLLPTRKGLHFHSLRHSFAQNAAECGVPMERLSNFLGHKDDRVTQEHYALIEELDWSNETQLTLIQYIESLQPIEVDRIISPHIQSAQPINSNQLPTWYPLDTTIARSRAA
jgi:integrase